MSTNIQFDIRNHISICIKNIFSEITKQLALEIVTINFNNGKVEKKQYTSKIDDDGHQYFCCSVYLPTKETLSIFKKKDKIIIHYDGDKCWHFSLVQN